MRMKSLRNSAHRQIACIAAGVAVAATIFGVVAGTIVHAADETKPAGEQVVADRYVVAVSGMT